MYQIVLESIHNQTIQIISEQQNVSNSSGIYS